MHTTATRLNFEKENCKKIIRTKPKQFPHTYTADERAKEGERGSRITNYVRKAKWTNRNNGMCVNKRERAILSLCRALSTRYKRGRRKSESERTAAAHTTITHVYHSQKQFCFIILCPFFFLSFSLQYIVPFLCSTISYSNNTLVWAHTKTRAGENWKKKKKQELRKRNKLLQIFASTCEQRLLRVSWLKKFKRILLRNKKFLEIKKLEKNFKEKFTKWKKTFTRKI